MAQDQPTLPSSGERMTAALCHAAALLGTMIGIGQFLIPVVIMLASDSPFVVRQAKEALNFQISLWLWVAIMFGLVLFTLGAGVFVVIPMAIVFAVCAFLLPIIATISTAGGSAYRYPFIFRLVK